ncbi:transcriptional regulator [Prevotella lacticifex]|uniref:helix-turn-helix domain-containing protein n=1 Tax=Prevotella lacticifex TaxID=2854755 RepID=UPI001CC7BC49|nr:helix-turn-helix domain-containing protein [Prevotella lacticifex]GJG67621.1 transcriptional regulator [Prevotella lacticifex]
MKNNQIKLKELNLEDLNNNDAFVDYYDGDIAFIDNISHLTDVAPIYAKMNFIMLCTKGRIQFNINDQPLMLTEQQVLLSAPFVILDNYLFSPNFECKILCLSDDLVHAMLGDQVNVWNLSVHSHRTSVIELPADDQQQLVYYYELVKFKVSHQNRRNNTFVLQTILQAMLMDLLTLIESQTDTPTTTSMSHGKTIFDDFLKLLSSKEVKHQPISNYASELNITPKYLTMLCTKYSGRPASDWIAQYTKEDIRYNLLHTRLSIKEISTKLGFPSISFFGSYVRRLFGASPSQLRKARSEEC